MRVRFSNEAKAKLRAIHSYIAKDSPKNADAMIDRITRRAAGVGDLPRRSRKVPEHRIDSLREVLERPYRIIYRIKPDEIEIVTVMHYRQLLPEDLV
jgi:toxin ParE1/3/4